MLQFLMDVWRDLLLLAMLCAVSTASMPYPVESGSPITSTQSLDFSLTRSQSVERDSSPNSTRPGEQNSSLASPQSVVQVTTLTSTQSVEQDSSLTSAQNVDQDSSLVSAKSAEKDSSLASPPYMEQVTFFTGTQTLEKDSSYTSISSIEQDSSLTSAQTAEKDSFLASPQSFLTSTKYAEKEDSSLPSVPRVEPGHHPHECHPMINILDTLLELGRVNEEEVSHATEQQTSTDNKYKILGIDAIYRRLIRLLLQLIHDNLTEEEIRAICICLCSMIPCPPECDGIEPPWGPVNIGG